MKEKISLLKKEILESLPQIPLIIDQVGAALDLVEKELDEGKVYRNFTDVLKVVEFTKAISEPKFFKTHLVVASALLSIPKVLEKEEFKLFDSASGAVRKAVEAVTVSDQLIEDKGCFKALTLNLASLAKENQEYLALALFAMLGDLQEIVKVNKVTKEKTPITPSDYITILGYMVAMNGLGTVKTDFLGRTKEIMNEIKILLNSEVKY